MNPIPPYGSSSASHCSTGNSPAITRHKNFPESRQVLAGFKKAFENKLNEVAMSEYLGHSEKAIFLTPQNIFMAVVLDCVNEGYKKVGQPIIPPEEIPPDLDQVLNDAIHMALDTSFRHWAQLPDNANSSSLNFNPRAKDTFHLLYQISPNTPFGRIPAKHRVRMCIDPNKLDALRELSVNTIDNPLSGFLFETSDNGKGEHPPYLYGMAKAWKISMENLHASLNVNLILRLHQACLNTEGERPAFDDDKQTSFTITLGKYLTETGREELDLDGMEIRNSYPYFSIGLTSEQLQELLDREDSESMVKEELDDVDFSNLDEIQVMRLDAEPGTLEKIVSGWLGNYRQKVKEEPENIHEHAIELCRKLELLHPFEDGNGRLFGIILLNHLLARAGSPLSMLDDPNLLVGFSRAESVLKLREGEKRVAEEFCASSTTQPEAPSVRKIHPLQEKWKAARFDQSF